MLVNICMLTASLFFNGLGDLYYCTIWAVIAVILYLGVSIKAHKKNAGMDILAIHHILFTVSLLLNLVVMGVYWPLLHEENMKRPIIQQSTVQYILSYMLHSIPFLSSLYNFFTIDAALKSKHVFLCLSIESLYIYTNYKATMETGKPLYWFLTWQDYQTVLVLGIINVIFVVMFFLLVYLT